MAEQDKRPVTMQELLVSSLAQTDALAKLLIEKGLITREEYMQKIFRGKGDVSKASDPDAMTITGSVCPFLFRFISPGDLA
jgi:hypothetical protein